MKAALPAFRKGSFDDKVFSKITGLKLGIAVSPQNRPLLETKVTNSSRIGHF
jgi:hypothetical protein